MSKLSFLNVAKDIVKQPTVPFNESFPISSLNRFLEDHPKLTQTTDVYGNIFIKFDGSKSSDSPRTILTAHLDHPGFNWIENIDSKTSLFGIYGGINKNLLMNQAVRIYNPTIKNNTRSIRGKIIKLYDSQTSRPTVKVAYSSNVINAISKHSFCCLDLTPWRIFGKKLHARVCDDLVGVAAGLKTLVELSLSEQCLNAGMLLTRAEEVGFAGMLGALNENYLNKKDIYVNIECSSIRAGAVLGGGPIVRVGDRITVFDPDISLALTYCATKLKNTDSKFNFQRKLMDGGACEATPLVRAGYKTGAVAIPLDNYHNDGFTKLKAEIVDIRDVNNLIKLLTTFCKSQVEKESSSILANKSIDKKLTETFSKYKNNFKTSPIITI